MKAKRILLQQDLDELIERIAWHHAYVREVHMVSPTYTYPDRSADVNAETPGLVRVLVITGDPERAAVELVFGTVTEFQVKLMQDVEPRGIVERDRIFFALTAGSPEHAITCGAMAYEILDGTVLGDRWRYAGDDPLALDWPFGLPRAFRPQGKPQS